MQSDARYRLWNGWGWATLLVPWGALLLGLTLLRVAFLVRYSGAFADASAGQVALAFLNGARYDLSMIVAFTGLPGLAALLLSPLSIRRWVYWVLFAWVVVVGLAFAVLGAIDLNYYAFVARRVSFEVIEMRNDWKPIVALIAKGYTLQTSAVLLALAGLVAAGAWSYRRLLERPFSRVRWWSHLAQVALLVPLIALIARGGIQHKPLSVGMAFLGPHVAVGHLALNPVFTTAMALWRGHEPHLDFMDDAAAEARTRRLLGLPGTPEQPHYPLLRREEVPPRSRPRNLVILTIESLSAQYIGPLGGIPDATPEFNRLAAQGLLFSRFYATGTRSLEGIASILSGFPALPTYTLIGSPAEQSSLRSLPLILKEHGYATLFLHGAFHSSMYFDTFAQRVGIDRFISKESYPNAERISDSSWGIFDHYVVERLIEELQAASKPVFALYFSLNPHTPYELPEERFKRFGPERPQHELLNAIGYADYALGRFFELARTADWFDDTVFMITADHNMGDWKLDDRARQWIPLLILVPGDSAFPRGTVNATLGSQADIAPTALELLGLSATHAFAGNSLLRPAEPRFVMFNQGGRVGWLTDERLLIHDLEGPLYFYDLRTDPQLKRDLLHPKRGAPTDPGATALDVQAYLQTLNNLLVQNRMAPNAPPRQPAPATAHSVPAPR